jgi:hypothetical protein
MKSHPHSRTAASWATCPRERRNARPIVAIALSASELRPKGCLIRPAQKARAAEHQSPIRIHQSRIQDFLIGSRQLLEIDLSSSQPTRKLFLTSGFSAFFGASTASRKSNPACALLYSRSGGRASATPVGWQARDHPTHLAFHSVCARAEPLRN